MGFSRLSENVRPFHPSQVAHCDAAKRNANTRNRCTIPFLLSLPLSLSLCSAPVEEISAWDRGWDSLRVLKELKSANKDGGGVEDTSPWRASRPPASRGGPLPSVLKIDKWRGGVMGRLYRPLPEGRAHNEGHTRSEVPFAGKTAKSSISTLLFPPPSSLPPPSAFSRRSPSLPESPPPPPSLP